MNIVALVGNIATTPELRHTTEQRARCTFRLAISRPGGQYADFFDIVCWERQAEIMHEHAQLGRRIAVDGRLRHTTWTHESRAHSRVEIIAHRIELLSPSRRSTAMRDEDPAPELAPG